MANLKDTKVYGDVEVTGSITVSTGASIDEFSTDGTLAGNSDTAVPTEKAVKAYVTAVAGGTAKWG